MEKEMGISMKRVNHKQLEMEIRECFKKEKPLFIWGGIGIGKSDSVKETAKRIAKEKGLLFNDDIGKINDKTCFSLIDVRLSQIDLTDLLGIPKVDEKNGTTKWYHPNWLPTNSSGILFLDELNLASPTIQATAYQLIHNRRIGDYVLPKTWTIISAGNRLEDRANIFETPMPLNNRFIHIELEIPSVDEWIAWGVKHNIDTRIMTFLKFKPILYTYEKNIKDKAFSTPRTWAMCSDMISDKDTTKDFDRIKLQTAMCVGEASALEFTTWLKLSQKVDVSEILKNPLEYRLPKETDMIYAVISSVSEHYKKDKKLLKPILQLATRLQAEFSVLLCHLIKAQNPKFKAEVVAMKEWKDDLYNKLSPYFEEIKEE